MKNKKIIAAMSAVMGYVRTQEDIAYMNAMAAQQAEAFAASASKINHWGQSGRLAQMQVRNLMQTKAFHGLKLR